MGQNLICVVQIAVTSTVNRDVAGSSPAHITRTVVAQLVER